MWAAPRMLISPSDVCAGVWYFPLLQNPAQGAEAAQQFSFAFSPVVTGAGRWVPSPHYQQTAFPTLQKSWNSSTQWWFQLHRNSPFAIAQRLYGTSEIRTWPNYFSSMPLWEKAFIKIKQQITHMKSHLVFATFSDDGVSGTPKSSKLNTRGCARISFHQVFPQCPLHARGRSEVGLPPWAELLCAAPSCLASLGAEKCTGRWALGWSSSWFPVGSSHTPGGDSSLLLPVSLGLEAEVQKSCL